METQFEHPIKEWQKWDSKREGHFDLSLFESGFVILRVFGKGTVEGTKNLTRTFDELFSCLDSGEQVRVLVDMSDMQGAPLRAQAVLGKWLVKAKSRIVKAGVFGGRVVEVKVARTIVKLTKLEGIVRFLDSEDEAKKFLIAGP